MVADVDYSLGSRWERLFLCMGVCSRSWFSSKWHGRPKRYL